MFTAPSLPSHILEQLPKEDRRSKFTTTEEGLFLVAGTHGFFIFDGSEPLTSGLWHEVQYASWKADSRLLTVVWTSPDMPPFTAVTTEENPEKFLRSLTSRVDRALVVSRQAVTPSGAILTATVRRRADDQLFSTVMVQGDLPVAEEYLARQLEDKVREEVGLDPA